jgi:hypothetical protein
MRALLFMDPANDTWLARNVIRLLRANAISWSALSYPNLNLVSAIAAAAAATEYTATGTYFAAKTVAALAPTAAAGYAADAASADTAFANSALKTMFWMGVDADCQWLTDNEKLENAAQLLSGHSLWHGPPPHNILHNWGRLQQELLKIDGSYSVWIEWFDRRIEGAVAGFYIPGDQNRQEDQQILLRLAEATNAEFWDKGAAFVNTILQGWIDEARARVDPLSNEALPEAPAQD